MHKIRIELSAEDTQKLLSGNAADMDIALLHFEEKLKDAIRSAEDTTSLVLYKENIIKRIVNSISKRFGGVK